MKNNTKKSTKKKEKRVSSFHSTSWIFCTPHTTWSNIMQSLDFFSCRPKGRDPRNDETCLSIYTLSTAQRQSSIFELLVISDRNITYELMGYFPRLAMCLLYLRLNGGSLKLQTMFVVSSHNCTKLCAPRMRKVSMLVHESYKKYSMAMNVRYVVNTRYIFIVIMNKSYKEVKIEIIFFSSTRFELL